MILSYPPEKLISHSVVIANVTDINVMYWQGNILCQTEPKKEETDSLLKTKPRLPMLQNIDSTNKNTLMSYSPSENTIFYQILYDHGK